MLTARKVLALIGFWAVATAVIALLYHLTSDENYGNAFVRVGIFVATFTAVGAVVSIAVVKRRGADAHRTMGR